MIKAPGSKEPGAVYIQINVGEGLDPPFGRSPTKNMPVPFGHKGGSRPSPTKYKNWKITQRQVLLVTLGDIVE